MSQRNSKILAGRGPEHRKTGRIVLLFNAKASQKQFMKRARERFAFQSSRQATKDQRQINVQESKHRELATLRRTTAETETKRQES
jgi:hypothetical protein